MVFLALTALMCILDNLTHGKPRFRFYSIVLGVILLLMAGATPLSGITVVCQLAGIGIIAWRIGVALAAQTDEERQ